MEKPKARSSPAENTSAPGIGPILHAALRDRFPVEPRRLRVARPLAAVSFGIPYRVHHHGAGNVPPTGPVILVANHPSYLDPIFIQMAVPRPVHYLAWDLAHDWPVVGRLMRLFRTIPVDPVRGERDSIRRTIEILRAGGCVGIFPERQRTQGPDIDPFGSGFVRLAQWTGAAIVPVTIYGTHRIWPRNHKLPKPQGHVAISIHHPRHPHRLESAISRNQERSLQQEITCRIREDILHEWDRLNRNIH